MASALSSAFCSALALPCSSASTSGGSTKERKSRKAVVTCCQSSNEERKWVVASRREMVASISGVISGLFALPALALLETDDDESLLEKVKEDRKKRIEKRGAVISYKDETESVQKAVYELSKAGQAIDGNDFGLANSVLGTNNDGWIQEVKAAISKVNKSDEEESEAANFSSSLQDLQSAVSKKDTKKSKIAFVASASALEKWSLLTGISDQIKGL